MELVHPGDVCDVPESLDRTHGGPHRTVSIPDMEGIFEVDQTHPLQKVMGKAYELRSPLPQDPQWHGAERGLILS